MSRRAVVALAAAFASSALMGAARVAVTEVVLPTYAFGIESADGPSMDHKSYHVLNGASPLPARVMGGD